MTTTRFDRDAHAEPWALPADEVAAGLGADPVAGLPERVATTRLAEAGANEVPTSGRPVWRLVLAQLSDTMIVVLLASAALTAVIGDHADMTVILAVIIVNSALGVVQEIRAGRAISALTALTAPTARVIRNGAVQQLPASGVVDGDLLRLTAGDIVPADSRLLRGESIEVDESALTGESVPVPKSADAIQPTDTPLADRVGMLLAGTVVTRGRGDAVVTATGPRSALGGIARMLAEHQPPATPLQRTLARLGRQLSVAAAVLCLLVAALGLVRGAARRDGGDGGEPRGRGDPGVAAGGRLGVARARRPTDGGPRCAGAAPARGRDTGLGHGHRVRQDRHPDRGHDGGHPALDPVRRGHCDRPRIRPGGRGPVARRGAGGCDRSAAGRDPVQ